MALIKAYDRCLSLGAMRRMTARCGSLVICAALASAPAFASTGAGAPERVAGICICPESGQNVRKSFR